MKISLFSTRTQPALVVSLTAALAAASVLAPQTALAHAVLLKAVPAANSTVTGPDVAMMFQFNSRVDAARSQISLVDASGKTEALSLDKQKALDLLTTHAHHLIPGKYAIHWQVLSVDGHITRGQIAFVVN